ncbi:MAG: hypothetical protein ACI87N_000099 [Flavobacteriales bacterium]|jgi:hypothetical protein
MCIISDKIKFCTCAKGPFAKLKHYWILHRYTKEKRELYMGLPLLPTDMIDLDFVENQSALLKRLNESDAFDIPIVFKPKDLLEIVINNTPDFHEAFTYSFKYNKGKWMTHETSPFDLMSHFDEEQFGKIKNALKRNKNNND